MNKIHEDGRALLKLSHKMGSVESSKPSGKSRKPGKSPSGSKPVPPTSVQRQDTDYDVKPEIPTPKPARPEQRADKPKHAQASQQFPAAAPDTGGLTNATQMGEAEGPVIDDARQARVRALRALHS